MELYPASREDEMVKGGVGDERKSAESVVSGVGEVWESVLHVQRRPFREGETARKS